jgi:hypothetical protein
MVVVLAIILVLVGLLSAAVRVAIIRGAQVRDRNDIMQLDMALQGFKTQFGFYPPSQLYLCEVSDDYSANSSQLSLDSQYYLGTMFPRLTFPTKASGSIVDWSGNGAYTTPIVLTGDQCLVFFLGGNPHLPSDLGGVNGFNTNPAQPQTAGGTTRIGPFFEFQATRLVSLYQTSTAQNLTLNPNNIYLSYLDTYKQQPILYFSAYKNANNYNRYGTSDCPYAVGANGAPVAANVWPYGQGNTQFWKPNSCQIITAGRNGTFCQNLNKTPATTPLVYTPGNAALNLQNGIVDGGTTPSDDQGNFATGLLGGGS